MDFFHISLHWFKEERKENRCRKLLFGAVPLFFQISFHTLFPFFISSISHSVFFIVSGIFTPAVLLSGCDMETV